MGNGESVGCCGCADTLDEVDLNKSKCGAEQYESRPISMGNYQKQKSYPKIIIQNTEEIEEHYGLNSSVLTYSKQADELLGNENDNQLDGDAWQEKPAFVYEDGSVYTGNWKREYRHGYGV